MKTPIACALNRRRLRAGSAALLLLWAVPALAQDIQIVAGSTTPIMPLTGEHFQAQVGETYFTAPTVSASLSRFGVMGTDLGYPLRVGDRVLFFFGDTVGAYRNGDRYFSSRGNPVGVGDSIGYFPAGDLSRCRYVPDLLDQLARGVSQPSADASGCPTLSFFQNLARGSDEHVFKPLVIAGLAADEGQGTFRVPTGVIHHNDRVYLFATTKLQEARPAGAFWLQSILAKSDQSPALWSDANPPAFTRLFTVTAHASIDDPANPPAFADEPGKFMAVQAVVAEAGQAADRGWTRLLPRELQNTDVALLFGRGWNVDRSDLYLAAFAMRDIEAGPAKWFYYAGNGRWTANERDAAPLLGADDVSHPSVTWNQALGQFVLLRGGTGRIVAQFAAAPWGPWSAPLTVISATDEWVTQLLHQPGRDRLVQSLVKIYNRDGSLLALPDDERGVPYNPNVLDQFTENADGSVTLYYTLSGWNPYQVFLMRSTFRRAPRR